MQRIVYGALGEVSWLAFSPGDWFHCTKTVLGTVGHRAQLMFLALE